MITIVMIISILVTMFSDSKYNFLYEVSEPVQISMLVIIAEIGMMLPIILMILKNRNDRNKKKERNNR